MKRGLISWNRSELPAEALDARLTALHRRMAAFDVSAAVVYTDVWRSNDVRYLSNFMPYWNRAFAVVPKWEKPILLCSLSPRVYPWIKSVTTHETILASPSLPAQLARLCTERGWSKIGVVDVTALPNDLYTQLAAEKFAIVDLPRSALRPAPAPSEVAMHKRAAQLVRNVLDEVLTREAIGLSDYEFAGRLERKLRRAGAEDLVLLICDGTTVPLPASGKAIAAGSSVNVSLEYNGHWAKLSRNIAGISSPLTVVAGPKVHLENLSGSYGWEGLADRAGTQDSIIAVQVEIEKGGQRLFYGETCLLGRGGLDIL